MNTKHTPGPWRIALGDNGGKTNKLVFNGSNIIADCENHMFHPETQESNARLIAAAPELLAVVVRLVNDFPESKYDCTGIHSLYEQARAAIAKAAL